MGFLSTDVCDSRCFAISVLKKAFAMPIGTLLDAEMIGDRYDGWSRSSLLWYDARLSGVPTKKNFVQNSVSMRLFSVRTFSLDFKRTVLNAFKRVLFWWIAQKAKSERFMQSAFFLNQNGVSFSLNAFLTRIILFHSGDEQIWTWDFGFNLPDTVGSNLRLTV